MRLPQKTRNALPVLDRVTRIFPLLLVLTCADSAPACEPAPVSEATLIDEAILVIGQVTGARYPEYESDVARLGAAAELEPDDARVVRVAVTDALRGSTDRIVEAVAYPCDPARPIVGERVIVFGDSTEQLATASAASVEIGLKAAVAATRSRGISREAALAIAERAAGDSGFDMALFQRDTFGRVLTEDESEWLFGWHFAKGPGTLLVVVNRANGRAKVLRGE